MKFLAHRGRWFQVEEKNSLSAIQSAFEHGYGIETDIRDFNGQLVISHNVATEESPSAREMLKIYRETGCESMLALNVKADGIQVLLEPLLEEYQIKNYYLFDMSIPELIVNEAQGLRYYTRHSDVEPVCVMYDRAAGVWMDSFYDEQWLKTDAIAEHLQAGKEVAIVSPELHGKEHLETWRRLKESGLTDAENLYLCTDRPDEAKEYFYGEN